MNDMPSAVQPAPPGVAPAPAEAATGSTKGAPGASGAATAASDAAIRQRRISDGAKTPVLPDCCNLGIALRIVIPLNLGAVALALALSSGLSQAIERLIDMAVLLEPIMLATMVVLCLVRKVVNGWPVRAQWSVGLGVPFVFSLVGTATGFAFLPAPADVGSPLWWVGMRVLLAVLVAYAVIEMLRLRARAFSPSLSEARLQALQARIRPHFLFNSLNTVLGLMRAEPRKAERTLEDLSELFRVFMRDTRELVPLDEEVITCKQYLAIEQLRLGDRLSVSWDLDAMPGDALLPSLLLQPLIENAVHHGIEPRTEPGDISIRIRLVGDRVRVEIVNPIAEHAPVRPGNQMALSNVRERLMLLYDMEAELRTAEEGALFSLFLEFPYRKERRRRDVRRHFNPDR